MRKFVYWLVPFALLFGFSASAEIKIAVLDFQRAVGESDQAKEELEKIRADLQSEEKTLNELGKTIQDLTERLQKDAEILGDEEKRRITKDIENKQVDYQFGVNKLQKELQDRQQELFRQMAPLLDAVLKDLIELEGYDAVFTRQNLLYVNSKHDITKKVTEKLNQKR